MGKKLSFIDFIYVWHISVFSMGLQFCLFLVPIPIALFSNCTTITSHCTPATVTDSLARNIYSWTMAVDSEKLMNKLRYALGDNCIQNFHLGWYIVRYTVGNSVLQRRTSEAVKHDFRTYMKILNMIIPILMHYCSFVSNWSVASHIMPHVTQRNVT